MRKLGFLVILAACAHASRSDNPLFWSEARTDHFLLRSDVETARDIQRAAADLELVRAAILASGFYDGVTLSGTTSVVELAGAHELHEFADQSIDGFVGFTVYGDPLMVVSADRDVSNQRVVKHELT